MTIEALAEKIAILEKENRISQINAEISRIQFTPDNAIQLTLELWKRSCVQTALGLVQQLDQANIHHPLVDFAGAHLGILVRDFQWLDRLEARLEGRFDEFRTAFPIRHHFMTEQMPIMVMNSMSAINDTSQVAACLRLARILDTETERLFPVTAGRPGTPNLSADSSLPRQTQLFADLPPVPRKPRRVATICRRWWSGPASRPFEAGPRFAEAFQAAGWESFFVPMESVLQPDDFQAAFATVEQLAETGPLDAVFFDQFGCPVNQCLEPATFIAFAERLRARRPNVRIVPVYLDPWQKQSWAGIREVAPAIDSLWSGWPKFELWQIPALANKVIALPFPMAINPTGIEPAKDIKTLSFTGSIYQYNFHRAFWLAEMEARKIPIHFIRKDHLLNDGLSPLESYGRYLRALKQERYPLNFSMRQDGTRVYTGRALETLAVGSCLVQEKSPDFHELFMPGRHYLEFDTIDELHDIARFIETSPEKADEIAMEGQRDYLAHYSDAKIIDKLERILWAKGS